LREETGVHQKGISSPLERRPVGQKRKTVAQRGKKKLSFPSGGREGEGAWPMKKGLLHSPEKGACRNQRTMRGEKEKKKVPLARGGGGRECCSSMIGFQRDTLILGEKSRKSRMVCFIRGKRETGWGNAQAPGVGGGRRSNPMGPCFMGGGGREKLWCNL